VAGVELELEDELLLSLFAEVEVEVDEVLSVLVDDASDFDSDFGAPSLVEAAGRESLR